MEYTKEEAIESYLSVIERFYSRYDELDDDLRYCIHDLLCTAKFNIFNLRCEKENKEAGYKMASLLIEEINNLLNIYIPAGKEVHE